MVESLKIQLMEDNTISRLNKTARDKEKTELEKIADEFGELVKYERVNPSLEDIEGSEFTYGTEREFLYYGDEGSWITAYNEVGQNDRSIEYLVDLKKLDLYISQLSKSGTKFIKSLVDILKRTRQANLDQAEEESTEKSFVGRNLKVGNYDDLPELIRINSELSK